MARMEVEVTDRAEIPEAKADEIRKALGIDEDEIVRIKKIIKQRKEIKEAKVPVVE